MNLFAITVENYQCILNIINKRKNDKGISKITIEEFMKELNKSKTWCKTHLTKINEYEKVINYLGNDNYTTNYKNILETKLFKKLIVMFMDTKNDIKIIHMNDFELMKKYDIDRKIVQKYRAYLTSGWTKER